MPNKNTALAMIDDFISSSAQLEALLLLRANPTRVFTPEQVSIHIFTGVQGAKDALFTLYRAGFLQRIAKPPQYVYQYQPKETALGAEVDLVAQLYKTNTAEVLEHIFNKPRKDDFYAAFTDTYKFDISGD
jgi:hypothetical protein